MAEVRIRPDHDQREKIKRMTNPQIGALNQKGQCFLGLITDEAAYIQGAEWIEKTKRLDAPIKPDHTKNEQ